MRPQHGLGLRSFHEEDGAHWSAIVSLATAFAMVLTVNCDRGVTARLQARAGRLLATRPDAEAEISAILSVYEAGSG